MRRLRAWHILAPLALVAACHLDQLVSGPGGSGGGGGGPPPPPTSGNLKVTTSTTGSNLDPDGYTVTIDGTNSQPIGSNNSTGVTFTGVATGSRSVALSGVAANCTVSGGATQTVTVTAGQTATLAFSVTCAATTGNLTVTTNTGGSDLDPDGYTVAVDGGTAQPIGINASFTFAGISTGSHSVTLSGVAANCTVSGGATQSTTVTAGQTASITFSVTCAALTGSLTVTTSTTGSNLPSGYTVTVDGGQSKSIAASGTASYSGLTATNHSVQLNGVPSNCTVSEANPQSVSVPANGTGQATFTVTCTAPNQPPTAAFTPSCSGLTCNFTNTSSDPDGSISSYQWDFGDGGTASSQNPSHGYAAGGAYTVTLIVTDNQGAIGTVSHSVTVSPPPPPNQPPVVTAGGNQNVLVGALFTLSGASFSDPNHNGPWTITIAWGDGSSDVNSTSNEGSISGTHSYTTLLPATYTITITVTDSGGLSGSASKTVSVTTL